MSKQHFAQLAPAAIFALALALPAGVADAAITPRMDNELNPRGWSAMAGTEPAHVRELSQDLPLSEVATGDQPWCDRNAELQDTLAHDFGERKIVTGAQETSLWGSDQMGTWTLVVERPDATSCIIASGIGYTEGSAPQTYFAQAGLVP